MRIYIHTDMEGISGIFEASDVDKGSRHAVERLMADVNAAVDGAFAGGATHVTVLDSHGGGGNFDIASLDKRAEPDPKANGLWWGKLDSAYDATFFVGAHAMAGTMNAFLDHTQSSTQWYQYIVNGRACGELAQWAMVAGHFHVPIVMVSGDDAAVREARDFFGNIECAAVKRGLGRNRAVGLDSAAAAEAIRQAASRSLRLIGQTRPYRPALPMEVVLDFTRADYCDNDSASPAVERLNARRLRWMAETHLALFPWYKA